MTQKESIIQILNQAEWVCGTVFLQNYLQEYRTRINELRKDGFTVEARRCSQHQHKAGMQEWSLRQKASVSSKTAPDSTIPTNPVYQPAKEEIHTPRGWAYFPPKFCCPIAQASQNRLHARGCSVHLQVNK
jgi:hypothetical protein